MFVTKEQTLAVTGYDVDATLLTQAQTIIEAYVGRSEAEVTDPDDLYQLANATAYQAAYMANDKSKVFEQAALTQIGQFGQLASFRQDGATPFVAPLAILACKNLTWRKARSVRTGTWYGGPKAWDGWSYE